MSSKKRILRNPTKSSGKDTSVEAYLALEDLKAEQVVILTQLVLRAKELLEQSKETEELDTELILLTLNQLTDLLGDCLWVKEKRAKIK